ncbi:CoA transferase [Actinomadura sp. KC06]|uniref:CaiB/BaiF CoA transferase family protein n=1 Tax=Actinomadura sp. KC06 TaxID=2530369 RepID=UPI00104B4B08|nr:CoA transferase [Actinomadura sp. KC06]TDD26263.1 CoA transferase [Actinomadura sp. KC06]
MRWLVQSPPSSPRVLVGIVPNQGGRMTAKNHRPAPKGPLVGIRVLDIGQLVAGPLIGTFLADWGADVVKIEQPGIGDPIRKLGSHSGAPLWWKVNGRGKRSVALDLRTDDGRGVLLRLVRAADILIENFTPGSMERWGLDYASLRAENPGIIMLRVSGFGQTGPNRTHRAFGRIAQSFSGFSSINGFPDRPPLHPGIPVGDYFGALTGTAAVLAAYAERRRSGEGQEIDLALYEACFRVMELISATYDQEGKVIGREGTSNTYVAPVGTWQTADGKWFSLTASTQPVAERLLETVGGSELASDPRFATNSSRVKNRAELDDILGAWVGRRSTEELTKVCDDNDVAYCIEYDIADIFADEHYRARGTIEAVDDPEYGPLRMPAVVPRFGRTPGAIRWTGEELDASHDDVLHDPAWGMPTP